MQKLKKNLTILSGIPLAIGSIIGSGILFLPSLTYSIAGSDVLVVWITTTLLCIPLLMIFTDMVKLVPTSRGIEGFISAGLGVDVAAAVPILFLGTVIFGMPSAAIIAGQYVEKFIGVPFWGAATGLILIVIAIGTNLLGVKLGGAISVIIAAGLFIVGCVLIALTTPVAAHNYGRLVPSFDAVPILSGIVVAFWAYAGFENLTFIAGEFRNSGRDFFISATVALLTCGVLYLALSLNFAALVNRDSVDALAGLSQLAHNASLNSNSTLLIVLFAVFAVAINLVSWTWGVSRLVYSSAEQGHLPKFLAKISDDRPKAAIIFLGALFVGVFLTSQAFPEITKKLLLVVSTNFVFIYVLCVASYISVNKGLKRIFSVTLLVVLAIALFSSGVLVAYPFSILIICSFLSWKRRQKHV